MPSLVGSEMCIRDRSEASDIREDKVALLKNMVDSGQYEVSGDDFASKLLERYNSL